MKTIPAAPLAGLGLAAAPALAQPAGGRDNRHDRTGGRFAGFPTMAQFVAAAAAAVCVALRLTGHDAGRRATRARDIPDERCARGEPDRADCDDRRNALDGEAR